MLNQAHFLNFGVGRQSVVLNFYHSYHDIMQYFKLTLYSQMQTVLLTLFICLFLGFIYLYFGVHGILCLTSTRDAWSIEASEPQSLTYSLSYTASKARHWVTNKNSTRVQIRSYTVQASCITILFTANRNCTDCEVMVSQ